MEFSKFDHEASWVATKLGGGCVLPQPRPKTATVERQCKVVEYFLWFPCQMHLHACHHKLKVGTDNFPASFCLLSVSSLLSFSFSVSSFLLFAHWQAWVLQRGLPEIGVGGGGSCPKSNIEAEPLKAKSGGGVLGRGGERRALFPPAMGWTIGEPL